MEGAADGLKLDERGGAVFMAVHAVPHSKGESIAGLHGESLRVKVQSPPEKGRANKDVIGLLATVLGVRRSRVEIVSGHASRAKRVRVEGLTAAQARARLGPFLGGG